MDHLNISLVSESKTLHQIIEIFIQVSCMQISFEPHRDDVLGEC